MKKLIFLPLMIILLVSYSCINSTSSYANYCNDDWHELFNTLKKCNIKINTTKFTKTYNCDLFKTGNKESSVKCHESLANISCEELKEFKKDYKLPEELKCFDMKRKTNKDRCIEEYGSECWHNFHSCGKKALKGLCKRGITIHDKTEARTNDKVFEKYCSAKPNANEIYDPKDSNIDNGIICSNPSIYNCKDITEKPKFDDEERITCRKLTKKEVCKRNYVMYCKEMFYSCGYDSLKGKCKEWAIVSSSEIGKVLSINIDGDKLDAYCDETENKEDDMDKNEIFYSCISFGYYMDSQCEDITDSEFFDFRKNNWKSLNQENYNNMCNIE